MHHNIHIPASSQARFCRDRSCSWPELCGMLLKHIRRSNFQSCRLSKCLGQVELSSREFCSVAPYWTCVCLLEAPDNSRKWQLNLDWNGIFCGRLMLVEIWQWVLPVPQRCCTFVFWDGTAHIDSMVLKLPLVKYTGNVSATQCLHYPSEESQQQELLQSDLKVVLAELIVLVSTRKYTLRNSIENSRGTQQRLQYEAKLSQMRSRFAPVFTKFCLRKDAKWLS